MRNRAAHTHMYSLYSIGVLILCYLYAGMCVCVFVVSEKPIFQLMIIVMSLLR